MKFEKFVAFSFQITVNNNDYDIYQSYIFQSYQLFEFIQCTYICSICILFQLLLNNEQVSIKAAFGSEALIRGRRGAYLGADAYKKKCGKAEDAQYSQ